MTPELTAKLDKLVQEIEAQKVTFQRLGDAGGERACGGAGRGADGLPAGGTARVRVAGGGQLQNAEIIVYLNRLADLLWLFARWVETKLERH